MFSILSSPVLVKEEPSEFDPDNIPNRLDDDNGGGNNVGKKHKTYKMMLNKSRRGHR